MQSYLWDGDPPLVSQVYQVPGACFGAHSGLPIQVKLFRVKELTGCWRDNGIQILND